MNYREEKETSKQYKKEYLDGIEALIRNREQACVQKRDLYIKDIFKNQNKYRDDLKKMLGWPLTDYEYSGIPNTKTEKLSDEENYSIYRMSFEILDGVWISGLLFKKDDKKRPMVIVQHGGLGTPELISGVYGDTSNYNNMLQRVICHDVNAFAPQLLLWDQKAYELDFNRQEIDARLKRVGSSVTAVEVFGIIRMLDWFEAQDYVKNFGMVGLSYGGFYTLFTSALETRIKSAVSCSFFNDRLTISWSDWTWSDSAKKFLDAEIACLVYPREICIEVGDKDELFKVSNAKNEWERLKNITNEVGTDWIRLIIFEGNHEFCKDDEPIKKLVKTLISE